MRWRLVLLLVALVGVWLAGIEISEIWAQRNDYLTAKPLAGLAYPFASEMKRFKEERGRDPNNLEEVIDYSSAFDPKPLRTYPHIRTTFILPDRRDSLSTLTNISILWLMTARCRRCKRACTQVAQ
jgi:hypothetical protein